MQGIINGIYLKEDVFMSLFSYISFPRQVDTSCLKRKFDESKSFTIGEIRGTELEVQWEKQYGGSIVNLLVQFYDSTNARFSMLR